jgi:hypothetical protein
VQGVSERNGGTNHQDKIRRNQSQEVLDLAKRLLKRPQTWEKDKTDRGSQGAKEVRAEIERLSPFRLELLGVAVETGYVPNLETESKHLDYGVFLEGRKIAEIDPTRCNWTFEESQFMPASFYKGKIIKTIGVPSFLVYDMARENKPLKDRCMWIGGDDVINAESGWKYLGGKMQLNYFPDKKLWHRGLESLIEELQWVAEQSPKP